MRGHAFSCIPLFMGVVATLALLAPTIESLVEHWVCGGDSISAESLTWFSGRSWRATEVRPVRIGGDDGARTRDLRRDRKNVSKILGPYSLVFNGLVGSLSVQFSSCYSTCFSSSSSGF